MGRISKPPGERKQEIIDTAYVLFAEKGYEETTVRDIVGKIGVAQGLFYYYFKSKEEVLFAVAEQFGGKLLATIAQTIKPSEFSPVQRARSAFAVIVDFLSQSYDTLQFPSMDSHVLVHFGHEAKELLLPYLTDLLMQGQESGEFHVIYPEYTARFILDGFIGLCLDDITLSAKDILSLVETFVERILALPEGALTSTEKRST